MASINNTVETATVKTVETTSVATTCPDTNGNLPSCAPLAQPFVPFQQTGSEQYQPAQGITRGTLFPGLDLPFQSMINDFELTGTPGAELMALGFAIKELQLYLDTHPLDSDVFSLLKTYIELYNEGKEQYVQQFGPLSLTDLISSQSYTWINNPWPWEYSASVEG